jgi:hypothetical protein
MKQFNLETQSWEEEGEELTLSSLELLQSIYRDCKVSLSTRMRAAALAIPFESPKLAVMAVSSMNGQDFGSMLDRAIARSQAPPKLIEHRSEKQQGPTNSQSPRSNSETEA